MNRKKMRGDWGENLVAEYLRKRGFEIVASQFRCRLGEIDLIARKDGVLCFVEVKTRADTTFGLPREAVGPKKQRRIRAAAAYYLAMHVLDCPVRFDVAEVYTEESPGELRGRVEYLEAAFD